LDLTREKSGAYPLQTVRVAEVGLARGHPVVATARNPATLEEFASHPAVLIARLDVTDPHQVDEAVHNAMGASVRSTSW